MWRFLRVFPVVILCVVLCGSAGPISRAWCAESVTEVYRSEFGMPRAVSVNTGDGSCWMAVGNSVMHLAANGGVLAKRSGFWSPSDLCVSPSDGSCWVVDSGQANIVHLAADGSELWRGTGFANPLYLAVNPADGSCWVTDYAAKQVIHLSPAHGELFRGGTFSGPHGVAVNPTDGSCWVVDRAGDTLVHLASDGTEIWRGGAFADPVNASVNPGDGSVWVADYDASASGGVVHLAADGSQLFKATSRVCAVAVDVSDGSCWASGSSSGYTRHFAADGTLLWQDWPTVRPHQDLAVNPNDHSVWAATQYYPSQAVVDHISSAGALLASYGGYSWPWSVSANPTDGSCWVSEYSSGRLRHVAHDGTVLWSGGGFGREISVNPANGSCWTGGTTTHHVAQDGTLLGTLGVGDSRTVAATAADGTCWVGRDLSFVNSDVLFHFADDGTKLSETTFSTGTTLKYAAANHNDGSCWLTISSRVLHYSSTGALLWNYAAFDPSRLAVNSGDGSCWVVDIGTVRHLSASHVPLWSSGNGVFPSPRAVSVNSTDGSCWVADSTLNRLVHIAEDGTELWRGGGFSFYSNYLGLSVDEVSGACWVADAGNSQLVKLQPNANTLNLAGQGGRISLKGITRALPWSGAFHNGCVVQLQVVPDPGYTFVGWTGDLTGSASPATITMDGNKSVTAHFTHTFQLVSVAASPAIVPSGGTCTMSATYSDSASHGVATWWWSDGGAGGSFSPSAAVQNPTYTAPANTSDGDVVVTLTVSATCDGPDPLSDSDSTTLTVQPVVHSLTVVASADPISLASSAGSVLDASWSDTRPHHTIATWSWDDAGAGGSFSPSADVQNPTYTTPWNYQSTDQTVTLTVTATCDGPAPLVDSDTVDITVRPAVVFSDVLPDHWAYEAIMACYDAGIVNGYDGGVYLPDLKVTRAQMAMYVSRALTGGTANVPEGPEEATFPDVPTGHWSYDGVEYAVGADVVTGYSDGSYQPAWVVTRGQMAVFIARSLVNPTGEGGLEGYAVPDTASFGDVPPDYWAFKHIEYCVGEEVVFGYSDDLYRPSKEVTRDQMAVYIARAFDLLD